MNEFFDVLNAALDEAIADVKKPCLERNCVEKEEQPKDKQPKRKFLDMSYKRRLLYRQSLL